MTTTLKTASQQPIQEILVGCDSPLPLNSSGAEEVAGLLNEAINRMTSSELVRVIRSVRGAYLRPEADASLDLYGHSTLRRLVFLTRRACRNQLAHQRPEFTDQKQQEWSGNWVGSCNCESGLVIQGDSTARPYNR